MKALCATPNGSVINHNSDLLFLSLMILLGFALFSGRSFLQQRVGCRDHDVSDQLECGERDENANGDFTGFYGIKFFEEIIHGSSPWFGVD